MKVLVTGSRGFLGTECVKLLKNEKYEVVECDIILGHNILKKETLEPLFMGGIDCCLHLAAVSNLNIFDKDEKNGDDINVVGTKILMDLCVKYNIKMYTASTCCLYGDNGVQVVDENSKISPTEAYASSKMVCERMSKQYNKTSGKNQFVCMRLATFYGGKYARGDLCISRFIKILHMGDKNGKKVIEIHGDGSMARTYTHVLDMASGIVTLLTHGSNKELPYDVYNVTRGESYTVWDIISEISKNIEYEYEFVVKVVKNRPRPFSQQTINSDRLKNLGWVPKYTWEEGIKEAINSFKVNGNKWVK
jgi:nucleoside-diphosphate-sugar epimerase